MKQAFYYILLIVFLQSCDYFVIKKDDRKPVARVHESFLYESDISHIFSKDISEKDSVLVATNYINNWIKQQLLLSKAQINLENKTGEFNDLVKKYREDLFINSYKEAVVKQYLNTDISEEDITQFYEDNNQNFKLNEELVKLKYIKIGKDVFDKKTLISLFKSTKKEDLDSLQARELFLKSHHLNDSIWVKYSDLLFKISVLNEVPKKQFLKKGNFIQKEDSLSLYLMAVKEVLNRNDIAPKAYITPTIEQMILHQRKLLLLRNIEETLIDDANSKNEFEIY
jgi:hypothetical protein